MPVTQDFLSWVAVGSRRKWSFETRSKKSEEERSQKMSREQSDGEDSVVGTGVNRFVDATAETEVELCLPLEADMETDEIPKDINDLSGSSPSYGFPMPRTPRPRRQLPGTGAQPVGSGCDRFAFEMPSPTYPGLDRQLPGIGIQPVKQLTDSLSGCRPDVSEIR